jgi:hypothetical protein
MIVSGLRNATEYFLSAALCPELINPDHWWHMANRSRYDGHSLGDQATFSCLHGFLMYFADGTSAEVIDTECRVDSTWSREITQCTSDGMCTSNLATNRLYSRAPFM